MKCFCEYCDHVLRADRGVPTCLDCCACWPKPVGTASVQNRVFKKCFNSKVFVWHFSSLFGDTHLTPSGNTAVSKGQNLSRAREPRNALLLPRPFGPLSLRIRQQVELQLIVLLFAEN